MRPNKVETRLQQQNGLDNVHVGYSLDSFAYTGGLGEFEYIRRFWAYSVSLSIYVSVNILGDWVG